MSQKKSASPHDAAERRPAWTFPVEEFSPSFKTPDVHLKPFNEVQPRPLVWEGDARLPRGAVTIIAGEHASGKTMMAVDWAARISRGERWSENAAAAARSVPGEPASAIKFKEVGQSIIAHAGDASHDMLKRRLDAAGADSPQVASLWLAPPEKGQRFNFDAINRRIYSLTCSTGGAPDLRLLVIDNLEAWAGNTQETPCWALMAFLLTRLSDLASATGIAIVVLANLPRSGGAAAARRLDQLLTQAPVVYLAASDPDRPERKLLLPVKNTLAPTAPARSCEIVAGRVAWSDDAVGATADEFLSSRSRRLEARHERESAASWLLAALAAGPVASIELFRQARECGISTRTLRRAAQSLGLSPYKASFDGPWQWRLGPALIPGEPASPKSGEPEASASVSSRNTPRSDQTEADASGSPTDAPNDLELGTWNLEPEPASQGGQPRVHALPRTNGHRNGRLLPS